MENLSSFVKKYCPLKAGRELYADYFNQIITFVKLSKDKNYIIL
jgi:hypothetical protein